MSRFVILLVVYIVVCWVQTMFLNLSKTALFFDYWMTLMSLQVIFQPYIQYVP